MMNDKTNGDEREYWETDDPNADVYVEEEGNKSAMLCPGCMALNSKENHFCEQCGKPITGIATSDPFGQVLSAGHAYRAATEKVQGRGSKVVLTGMWLIFGPTGIAAVVGLFRMLQDAILGKDMLAFDGEYFVDVHAKQPIDAEFVFQFLIMMGYALMCGWLLWKVTASQMKEDDEA